MDEDQASFDCQKGPDSARPQSGLAKTSDYQQGFQIGVGDGRGSCNAPSNLCGEEEYISHPGNDFEFHTPEFNMGYVAGWCSVNPSNTGSSLDTAS